MPSKLPRSVHLQCWNRMLHNEQIERSQQFLIVKRYVNYMHGISVDRIWSILKPTSTPTAASSTESHGLQKMIHMSNLVHYDGITTRLICSAIDNVAYKHIYI